MAILTNIVFFTDPALIFLRKKKSMATVDKSWGSVPPFGGCTDGALTANITYADVASEGGKFTSTKKQMSSLAENADETPTTDTWGSWAGLGRIYVTSCNINAWSKKNVATTAMTANTATITVLDGSLAAILADTPVKAVSIGTGTDGSYVAQSAGTNQNTNAGKGGVRQVVRGRITNTMSSSNNTTSIDIRFNAITVRMTYNPVVQKPPALDGLYGGFRYGNPLGGF